MRKFRGVAVVEYGWGRRWDYDGAEYAVGGQPLRS